MSDWLNSLFGSESVPAPDKRGRSRWFLTIMGTGIGWLCAVCFAILYQTVATHSPPVKFTNGNVTGWLDAYASTLVISYAWDETTIADSDNVGVRSFVECAVGPYVQAFDIPIILSNFRAGKPRRVNRLAVYPYPVPEGSECGIYTTLEWTPTLSLNKHTWTFPRSTFRVMVGPVEIARKPG